MEENKQWKQLPFTIELAKKIQSGEVEGRIVTNHGKVVTLVDAAYGFNEEYWIPIIWHWTTEDNQLVLYNSKGECRNSHSDCYLHIELPEEEVVVLTPSELQLVKETPKHKFKPFDKVLVRDNTGEKWVPDIFRYYDDNGNYDYPYRCCANDYRQCIPYTGNEHLLGTTINIE